MKLLEVLKEQLGSSRGRLQKIREDLTKARARVKELQALPLPAEEVADLAMEIMERHAVRFQEYVDRQVAVVSRHPLRSADDPVFEKTSMVAAAGIDPVAIEYAMAYYLRPYLRDGFLLSAKRQSQNSGPPRATRVKELTRLADVIADLEADERAIVDEFTAARNEIDA